ncbi:MAG: serine/threonine protein kinase [Clostridia bacterium]|nr:serine/threonine protein kinase [Clostridia bacterium]
MKTDKKREEIIAALKEIYDTENVMAERDGKLICRIRHKENGREFILKSLNETLPVYGFLAGINCANLPRVYEVFECEDGAVLIEEYVRGTLLSDISSVRRLDYKEAKRIMTQLCGVLSYLHENGYVHRDIKPENVMLCGDNVKLIDFDAARMYNADKTSDTRVLGTLGYASPEQFGVTQSDARVDIYALGVLLNVMLTGVHPSEAVAPGRAGRIVLKCTQINPKLRYKSAARLAAAL